MGFASVFPATTWVFRKLISKRAKRIYLVLLIPVLLLMCIAIELRIEAAIFAHRAKKIVAQLSTLRSGVTSRQEAFQRIPGLQPSSSPYAPAGSFELEISNSGLSSWAFEKVAHVESDLLSMATQWLGVRYGSIDVMVRVNNELVSGYGYNVVLSNGERYWAIRTEVETVHTFSGWSTVDESPDYRVIHESKKPSLDIAIEFTEQVSPELRQHAFDARLHCMWSLAGCQTAAEIYPLAEADRRKIEQSARHRIRSSNPCPESILPRRARDTKNIFLVEVTGFRDARNDEYPDVRYVNFKLIKVLKEAYPSGIRSIDVLPKVDPGYLNSPIDNPSTPFMKPGRRVLLFSDDDFDSRRLIFSVGHLPCDAMPATDTALKSLEQALIANSPPPLSK